MKKNFATKTKKNAFLHMFKLRFLRYALKGSVIYAFKRVFSPLKRVSTQRFFDPGDRNFRKNIKFIYILKKILHKMLSFFLD
jgi:hypothetical protein